MEYQQRIIPDGQHVDEIERLVVDADALWELEPFARSAPTILTPHTGELARMLRADSRDVDAHRLASAQRAATRFGAVVLLKGADTIVASPREGVLIATYGTPALATAGTGDVLTGIVAAFLAKGMDARLAAGTAAVAHGVASELVVVDSALRPEVVPELWEERQLKDGSRHQIYKRYFTADQLAHEINGVALMAGQWFVAARARLRNRI